MAEGVVNASPLIYLSSTGHIDLLRLAGAPIAVPEAVAREVLGWGEDDPARRALANVPWLRTVPDPPAPAAITAWDLGAGESAVLAWALAHPGVTAVIDDLAARRCAQALRLPVRGHTRAGSDRPASREHLLRPARARRAPRGGHVSLGRRG